MKSTSTTTAIDNILNYQKPVGFVLYVIMIVFFTFFYSNLQIDAKKISEDLKKSGGAIPDVRPGVDTKKYIGTVLNRITVVGALFLTIIAAIPIIVPVVWTATADNALSLGGTGLIIVAGVALETIRQIRSILTRKEYHGYIRK
jgi:preprotein translocase subunit SecY